MPARLELFAAVALGLLIGFLRIYLRGLSDGKKVNPKIFFTYPIYIVPFWYLIVQPDKLTKNTDSIGVFFLLWSFLSIIWFSMFRKQTLPHASPFLTITSLGVAAAAAYTIPFFGLLIWPIWTVFFLISILFLVSRSVLNWYAMYILMNLLLLSQSLIPMGSRMLRIIGLGETFDMTYLLSLCSSAVILPVTGISLSYLFLHGRGKHEPDVEYRQRVRTEEKKLISHEFPSLVLTWPEIVYAALVICTVSAGMFRFPEYRILILNAVILGLSFLDERLSYTRARRKSDVVGMHLLIRNSPTNRWFLKKIPQQEGIRLHGFSGTPQKNELPRETATRILVTITGWKPQAVHEVGQTIVTEADEIGEIEQRIISVVVEVNVDEKQSPPQADMIWISDADITTDTASPSVIQTMKLFLERP